MGFNLAFKVLIDCFKIVILASLFSALPDDGDYTETCWSLSRNNQQDATF